MAESAHFPGIDELMSDYLEKKVISYWPPYEKIHLSNINKLQKLHKKRLLP